MKLCIVIPAHNEEAVLEHTHKALNNVLCRLIAKGEISADSFLCFVDDGSKCIVIPAHNEEAVLEHTHKALNNVLCRLIAKGEISADSFLCFVDDGSKDRTWEILCSLSKDSKSIESKSIESKQGGITTKALKLSRNCGHQNALLASFLCFVDDGSKDRTWEILCSLSKDSKSIESKSIESKQGGITTKALKLSRNCGHQNALLAGLEYVADKCDCAISIDCDLQDDISVIDEFVAKAKMGAEVIYGVRKSRQKDSFFKKHTALGFYKLMEIMGVKITYNHADYRLLSNRAIKALLRFSEVNLFLRGIVPLLGFKTAIVEYDRLSKNGG